MNARTELERTIEIAKSRIVCATITRDCTFGSFDGSNGKIDLMHNHTPEELDAFMQELDFEYDSGYGMQYLDGIVWLENGSWLERGEYDGSEWWVLRYKPVIPAFLMKGALSPFDKNVFDALKERDYDR